MLDFHVVGKMVLLASLGTIVHPYLVMSCDVKYTCAARFEFSSELHYLRGYKSCKDVYNRDCICQQPIDVLFNEAPPYIFTSENNRTSGIIPGKFASYG